MYHCYLVDVPDRGSTTGVGQAYRRLPTLPSDASGPPEGLQGRHPAPVVRNRGKSVTR